MGALRQPIGREADGARHAADPGLAPFLEQGVGVSHVEVRRAGIMGRAELQVDADAIAVGEAVVVAALVGEGLESERVGGSAVPSRGAESVLGTASFRRVGQWSYSWYLWHWPFLVIAAEAAHTTVLQSSIARIWGWSFWLWECRLRPTGSLRTQSAARPSS